MTWVAAVDYRRATRVEPPLRNPCQVYGKVEHIGAELMIGAIASGAADAKLSHIGSKIAVRSALAHMQADPRAVRDAASTASAASAQKLYRAVVSSVLRQIRAAAFDHVASTRSFAASLAVFAAEPGGLAAMQIGNGLIVSRGRDSDYALIFENESLKTGFADTYVTCEDVQDAMRVGVAPGPVGFLCVASETLSPLSLRPQDGMPRKRFFRQLDRYASIAPSDTEVHRGIRSFLRSEQVNGSLDDDLGLALCGYRAQGELFSAAAE